VTGTKLSSGSLARRWHTQSKPIHRSPLRPRRLAPRCGSLAPVPEPDHHQNQQSRVTPLTLPFTLINWLDAHLYIADHRAAVGGFGRSQNHLPRPIRLFHLRNRLRLAAT
jgi:hypothetical protein